MLKLQLHWQILIAIVLGALVGILFNSQLPGVSVAGFQFVGDLFLSALKMLIVPLIMSSIIVGIAGIGNSGGFGRMGGFTLLYYLSTSLIAILIGLSMVNLIVPGVTDGAPVNRQMQQSDPALKNKVEQFKEKVKDKDAGDVVDVFKRMLPPNIVAAATDNRQMLGIIVFALLFGFFMTKIDREYYETLYRFWQGVFQTMMKLTDFVIKFAPIGVFALVTAVVAATGFQYLGALLKFLLTVLLALGIHFFIVMPVLLSVLAGVDPRKHIKAMLPALLTAFSTSSSSATLPLTMECVEKNVGVSNRTTSFVLPLGATVNMDGTALYECVAAIFIAQAFDIPLSMSQQFLIVVIALMTSIGVAGIPHASLVAISLIMSVIGLPAEGIALILVFDRILDMCRTTVNVFSDSCGATIIARLQGEKIEYPNRLHGQSVPSDEK